MGKQKVENGVEKNLNSNTCGMESYGMTLQPCKASAEIGKGGWGGGNQKAKHWMSLSRDGGRSLRSKMTKFGERDT